MSATGLVNSREIAIDVIEILMGWHIALAQFLGPIESVDGLGVAQCGQFLLPELTSEPVDLVQRDDIGTPNRVIQISNLTFDAFDPGLERECPLNVPREHLHSLLLGDRP